MEIVGQTTQHPHWPQQQRQWSVATVIALISTAGQTGCYPQAVNTLASINVIIHQHCFLICFCVSLFGATPLGASPFCWLTLHPSQHYCSILGLQTAWYCGHSTMYSACTLPEAASLPCSTYTATPHHTSAILPHCMKQPATGPLCANSRFFV